VKKSLILALLTVAFSTQAISLEPSSTLRLAPTKEQAQTAYLSAQLLGRYHYKTPPLDDALSEKIFDRYLKSLDPERLFFTQSDVDAFSDARTRLDDPIQRGHLAVPFAMLQR